MADQSLALQIKVNSEGLVTGLQVATRGVDGAAQQIRSSFQQMAAGGATSGRNLSASLDDVVGHVRGMRAEMRLGNFMASQLAEIGIAAKSSAAEMSTLVASFALGGPLGAGIEIVKMLASSFGELGKDEAKAKEEFEKWAAALETGTSGVRESVTAELLALNGASKAELAAHKDLMPLLDERLEWQAKEKQATSDLAAIRSRDLVTEQDVIQKLDDETDALKRQAVAREHLAKLAHEFVARAEPVVQLGDADDFERQKKAEKQHEETLNEQEKQEKEFAAHILAERVQLATGEEKIAAENAAKIEEINAKYGKGTNIALAEIAVQSQLYVKQTNDFRDAEEKRITDHIIDLEAKASDKVRALWRDQDQQRAEFATKRSEAEKKLLEEQVRTTKELGSAVGSAISGMISGTQSLGQAFKDVSKVIVKTMSDTAIKDITLNAADAASGAAASQAGIPIVGPALAVGAMATMESLVLGLIGGLPSAAGGYDIPAGINPLVQAHAEEMVLPAPISRGFRSLFATMGGEQQSAAAAPPSEVHFHIQTLDAHSFERFLDQRADTVHQWIYEQKRNGRLR